MCTPVVLDASAFDVLHEDSPVSAGAQLRRWIGDGHGRVAYSTYGRCGNELKWDKKMWELVQSYRQRGVADPITGAQVQQEEDRLRNVEPRSGEKDKPMLALAAASDARVMVVRDENLRADFEDIKLMPTAQGHRRRAFPLERATASRNDFLHRRRCSRLRRTSPS